MCVRRILDLDVLKCVSNAAGLNNNKNVANSCKPEKPHTKLCIAVHHLF